MSDARDSSSELRRLGPAEARMVPVVGGVGLALVLLALVVAAVTERGWQRFCFAYLVGFSFVLTVALGALFFVILQHLTRAGWSVVLRRLVENVASVVPALAVLVLPLVAGIPVLYPWSHPDHVASDPLLQAKSAYLNLPFFLIRLVVYFVAWSVLSRYFLQTSVRQDASGEASLSLQMQRRAAAAMVVFALTLTFASFDLLMSLDPHWFSTIIGVYVFAGATVASLGVITAGLHFLQRRGYLLHSVTVEHYHDLGKLLFAFVVFWAYIAFSQYMLTWYANLPEETGWFLRRQSHGWGWISLGLIAGHFLVPFLLLLSRRPKRHPALLAAVSGWVVLMHWLDLYWLVMPEAGAAGAIPGLLDVSLGLGLAAMTAAFILLRMQRQSLIAEGDPRLAESQTFENA